MKISKKSLILIFMLIIITFVKPMNFEAKKDETVNNIELLPQTMSVYEKWSFTTGFVIYSSPTIADLDKDGVLEIIVGT